MKVLSRMILAALLLAAALVFSGQAFPASVTLAGAGKATVTVTYTGPGDVIATGWLQYNGFRCFSSTYAGNMAQAYDSVTTTTFTISCASGGVVSATDGSGHNLTNLLADCVSTAACLTVRLYDQSGNSSDMTGSGGSRPPFITNCAGLSGGTGHTMCLSLTSASVHMDPQSASGTATAQPFTWIFTGQNTGTSESDVLVNPAGPCIIGFWTGTQLRASCTSFNAVGSLTSTHWYTIGMVSAASNGGYWSANSTVTSGITIGTFTSAPNSMFIGNNYNGSAALVTEIAVLSGDKNANLSAYYSNASSYWGGF